MHNGFGHFQQTSAFRNCKDQHSVIVMGLLFLFRLKKYILSGKLMAQAETYFCEEDFENAYISVMKLLSIVTYVHNTEKDKKYANLILKDLTLSAVQLAEKAKERLMVLYRKKSEPAEIDIPSSQNPGTAVDVGVVIPSTKEPKLNITAAELYSSIKGGEMTILIMDTQPERDFEKSHVFMTNPAVNIINVPGNIIQPG